MKKILILIVFIFVSWPAFAETVTLKNGKVYEGNIIEKTARYIRIQSGNKTVRILLNMLTPESKAIVEKSPVTAVTAPTIAAEDAVAKEVIEKTLKAYKALNSYQAKGTITANIETAGRKQSITTDFTIMLKKPNLYLVSWTQPAFPDISPAGVVWSDGKQPYLYLGINNRYVKYQNDQMAFAAATGISAGAALTIPSLFFPLFDKPVLLSALVDPKVVGSEKIGDEDCYVIRGTTPAFTTEIYWISKTNSLVLQHSQTFQTAVSGENVPSMTDEQIDEYIKAMGEQVTDDAKAEIRSKMKSAFEMMKNLNLAGTSTEIHSTISTADLVDDVFRYEPPAGAVLKDALIDEVKAESDGEESPVTP